MRKLGRWALVGLLMGSTALADPNDFDITALQSPGVEPNAAFAGFAREFAGALTSTNLMPPGTLGHAGFNLSVELSLAFLNGSHNPGDGQFLLPTESDFANRGPLLLPSLHVRKGLPFSFEVGARVTWIDRSQMGAAMGEIRWAVNEGFAYLPDVCVRVFGMKLFNTREINLGAVGVDLGAGKRFAIGGMITLNPYVGWNPVWVGANTSLMDVKALKRGENAHNRFYGGVRFIGGIIQVGAEASYSVFGSSLPSLLTFNTTLGLDF